MDGGGSNAPFIGDESSRSSWHVGLARSCHFSWFVLLEAFGVVNNNVLVVILDWVRMNCEFVSKRIDPLSLNLAKCEWVTAKIQKCAESPQLLLVYSVTPSSSPIWLTQDLSKVAKTAIFGLSSKQKVTHNTISVHSW